MLVHFSAYWSSPGWNDLLRVRPISGIDSCEVGCTSCESTESRCPHRCTWVCILDQIFHVALSFREHYKQPDALWN